MRGFAEPGEGAVDDLLRAALGARLARRRVARRERVVVDVEALVEAGRPRDGIGADERGGVPARALEDRRERRQRGRQRTRVVVADAVLVRQAAGHDAGVRRPRLRHVHDRVLEQHALAGETVERRRRALRVAVGADVVGAQRVDGDEEHVGPPAARGRSRRGARRRPGGAPGEREHGHERGRDHRFDYGRGDERSGPGGRTRPPGPPRGTRATRTRAARRSGRSAG